MYGNVVVFKCTRFVIEVGPGERWLVTVVLYTLFIDDLRWMDVAIASYGGDLLCKQLLLPNNPADTMFNSQLELTVSMPYLFSL